MGDLDLSGGLFYAFGMILFMPNMLRTAIVALHSVYPILQLYLLTQSTQIEAAMVFKASKFSREDSVFVCFPFRLCLNFLVISIENLPIIINSIQSPIACCIFENLTFYASLTLKQMNTPYKCPDSLHLFVYFPNIMKIIIITFIVLYNIIL